MSNQLQMFSFAEQNSNAWKSVVIKEIPDWTKQYKMGKVIEEARLNGITILGAGVIPSTVIDKIEQNQARAEDYDKSHVAQLRNEISTGGLDTLPAVTYDHETGLVTIADGHHRIKSLILNSLQNGESRALIPVLFIEFPSDHSQNFDPKKRFLRRSNNHNSSKSNTKTDWVKHIVDYINDNSNGLNWRLRRDNIVSGTYSDEEKQIETESLRSEVFAELTACGCTHQGKHRTEIFLKAFENLRTSTVRNIECSNSKRDAKMLFNSRQLEKWHNNRFSFSAGADASRKAVKIAEIEWAKMMASGKVNTFSGEMGMINMLTYFPGSYITLEKLNEKRQLFLDNWTLNNKMFRNSPVRVNKISFEPQFRCNKFSETLTINYVWDPDTLEFVLVKD